MVAADFFEGHCAGFEAVLFGGWGGVAGWKVLVDQFSLFLSFFLPLDGELWEERERTYVSFSRLLIFSASQLALWLRQKQHRSQAASPAFYARVAAMAPWSVLGSSSWVCSGRRAVGRRWWCVDAVVVETRDLTG